MAVIVAIAIPALMVAGWLIHIAVDWHWDFRAWYNDSDEDYR